jgi:hypothetical protein
MNDDSACRPVPQRPRLFASESTTCPANTGSDSLTRQAIQLYSNFPEELRLEPVQYDAIYLTHDSTIQAKQAAASLSVLPSATDPSKPPRIPRSCTVGWLAALQQEVYPTFILLQRHLAPAPALLHLCR